MKPKLLSIFNVYLQPGGEEEAVGRIAETLRADFDLHECNFSSATWQNRGGPNVLRQALWMVRNPHSLTTLRENQKRFDSEAWLVHNVFPVGSAAIYSEAQRLRVPVIQYLHNFRPFSVNGYLWAGGRLAPEGLAGNYWPEIKGGAWQDSTIKSAWFALVLSLSWRLGWWKSVKAWVANSEFVRHKMIEAGLPENDVFTLHYPWVIKASAETMVKDHYLFLGRLIEAKGITVLLQAWRKLEARLGAMAPLLVIAGQGPLAQWVAAEAARLRKVTFVGHLSGDEKQKALDGARAVIAPSLWWEAFGLIAYEAYECGIPMLAARSGGLTETVSHGETGFLHSPGNAEELAHQVEELERNSAGRQEMGRAGRLWLESATDPQKWRENFQSIFLHACRS